MIEEILENFIQSNGENLLVNAAEAVIKKSKDKTAWKKLFVNTGEFFIRQEQSAAEHIYEDLSEILSKTNMDKLAQNMRAESGYQLKKQLPAIAPEKYDHYFQQDWREEQKESSEKILAKINKMEEDLALYRKRKSKSIPQMKWISS